MAGPLSGIKVLEFSQVIAAPYAGQILADLGADVIKVEPPHGESWRLQLQFAPTESKTYQCLNRGKQNLTLSLEKAEAQDIVHQLVPDMDVVLINYRPDVPPKFQIDYETLAAINNALIYVDLTAFGRRGPWALRPGYDGAIQAVSGLMAAEGKTRPGEGSPMVISSSAVADFCSGYALADAVVTALFHRARTGEGQMVECSLLSTALNLQPEVIMEHPLADIASRNPLRDRRRKRAVEGAYYKELLEIREEGLELTDNYFYRPFLCADGGVVIAAETPEQKAIVRELFGLSDRPNESEILGMIDELEASPTSDVLNKLIEADVPAAPLQFVEELPQDVQVTENDWLVEMEHEVTGWQQQLKVNLTFSDSTVDVPEASPTLGRDTEKVLASLGYDEASLTKLRDAGVIR